MDSPLNPSKSGAGATFVDETYPALLIRQQVPLCTPLRRASVHRLVPEVRLDLGAGPVGARCFAASGVADSR
jgi:hypothetical protein